MHDEPGIAVRVMRSAFRLLALPFSLPFAAVRGARSALAERGQSAEQARFNTRAWTPELLKHLEWRRFEETCAAYFDAAGIDTASTVVRCKAWDAYRVGIKPMRELRAAMRTAGAGKGLMVTSGRFTREAAAFAAAEGIELVDGAALLERFAALPAETALALLRLATQGDFLTPTCPGCGIKMTARKSTQGGRTFWGCANYPRCKQTFF